MYLIDINVFAEIDEYPSVRFQDIRKKKNKVSRMDTRTNGRSDRWTNGQRENSIPQHKQSLRGVYNKPCLQTIFWTNMWILTNLVSRTEALQSKKIKYKPDEIRYKPGSNDDPGLTLILFSSRSDLLLMLFMGKCLNTRFDRNRSL